MPIRPVISGGGGSGGGDGSPAEAGEGFSPVSDLEPEARELRKWIGIIPRGWEWNRRANIAPENAIFFQRSGYRANTVPGADGLILSFRVPLSINGLRVSQFAPFTYIASGIAPWWIFRRNGVAYDAHAGQLYAGAGSLAASPLPVFMVYESGDFLELYFHNSDPGNLAAGAFIYGWIF